jgi:predicted PurR-regulated permease PerM
MDIGCMVDLPVPYSNRSEFFQKKENHENQNLQIDLNWVYSTDMSQHSSESRRFPKRIPTGKKESEEADASGPKWGNTTKLVISLSLFTAVAWLFVRFESLVAPLVMAVLLAYLIYPLASLVKRVTHMSWRLAVSFLYLFMILFLMGLTALGGLAILDQSQNLIGFLQKSIVDLPNFINTLVSKPIELGLFKYQLDMTNFNSVSQAVLGMVEPLLTRTGALIGSLATGTATFFGWVSFTLLVSYFMLTESGGVSTQILRLNIPGYGDDFKKIGSYLGGIWNAFLRGQLTVILITIMIYIVLLGVLGLKYFLGLALLAGLARFVPYVGPIVAWTSYGLVAFFQGSTLFGLSPVWYVVLVVGTAWTTDTLMDNLFVTRLMGNALKVHPAVVMVAALAAGSLMGIVGIILAGPVVATLRLLLGYVINRLLDRDPWATFETNPPMQVKSITNIVLNPLNHVLLWWRNVRRRTDQSAS